MQVVGMIILISLSTKLMIRCSKNYHNSTKMLKSQKYQNYHNSTKMKKFVFLKITDNNKSSPFKGSVLSKYQSDTGGVSDFGHKLHSIV